ncbi:MAG: hypothetical protein Q9162_000722 [Coniocarpon cinnabarinum]
MSLSAEQRAKYTPIIDGLLKASNLEEVSAKRIRDSLQRAVDEDLSEYKGDLKTLIHERFDIVSSANEAAAAAKPEPNGATSTPKVNGTTSASSPTPNGVASSASPLSTPASEEPEERPKKKQKKSHGESDAALAARLQAEENGRSRPTRGGATRKKAPPVKKSTPKKKKSKTRVDEEDDSGAEGSGSEDPKKKRKPGGAFNAPLQLSAPLAALLGEQQLSRPQTVKRIWDHIKENNLQHENDKRQIRCDESMRAVFNQDNIHMFSMNKTLSKHLYPLPEATANGEE